MLTHTTGLQHAFPAKATFDKLCDWEATQKMLEAARPAWPPGTRASYHYFTFGWLVAALVEKASGIPFGKVSDSGKGRARQAGHENSNPPPLFFRFSEFQVPSAFRQGACRRRPWAGGVAGGPM